MQLTLTSKQAEYVREANHRWNFAVGAVRSGKSHLACLYTIPKGLMDGHGRKGINLILGATRETIERNVLTPMRDTYGEAMVGSIRGSNITTLFGEKVYCIGAENKRQVSKIRGSEVKFCYVDEICDVSKEVFDILKSRLSLPYSECHAACNPAWPQHYVKQFIDKAAESEIDLYYQHYTIWDNPFLPESYIRSLEAEYSGTVYYDRYIRGLWTQAEGLVYPNFESAIEDAFDGAAVERCISCDYGTQNPFAAYLWEKDAKGVWHAVREYYYGGRESGRQKTDADYVEDMLAFASGIVGEVEFIVDPSAASFIAALRRSGRFRVRKADNKVADGIRDTSVCLQNGTVRITRACEALISELHGYVWDEKSGQDVPVKSDDHGCDAMRYFVRTKRLCRKGVGYISAF